MMGRRRSEGWANAAAAAALLLAAVPASGAEPAAEAWPSFRGPHGSGTVDRRLFDPSRSSLCVAWSIPVPGSGHSSPITDGRTVYVTTATQRSDGRLLAMAAHWVAATSLILAAWLGLLRATAGGLLGHVVAGTALRIGILFVLALMGEELFACRNDGFRTAALRILLAWASLETARALAGDRRWARLTIAVGGMAVALAANHTLLAMPGLRQPDFMAGLCLLPLLPAALAATEPGARFPGVRVARRVLPLVIVGAPVAFLLRETYLMQLIRDAVFWRTQPMGELPSGRLAAVAGVAVAVAGGRLLRRHLGGRPWAAEGLILLTWAALACVPALSAPAVNGFVYLRYQLARGRVESPLGLHALAMVGALAGLACLAPFASRRLAERLTQGRLARAGLLTLPLLAGAAPMAGSQMEAADGTQYAIVALDAATGRARWTTVGLVGKPAQCSAFNTQATPTPALAGGLVAGYFGAAGAFACDAETGALHWTYTDLPYTSTYGAASSLAASRSAVIVQSDSEKAASYIVALSLANGRPLWRHAREEVQTWRSPVVFTYRGKEIVCAWAKHTCDLLEAETGAVVTRVQGIDASDRDAVAGPVVAQGWLTLALPEHVLGLSLDRLLAKPRPAVQVASDGGATGALGPGLPVVRPEVRLDLGSDGPTCSTPAAGRGGLCVVSDTGVVQWFARGADRSAWRAEVGECLSSPALAGDQAYVVSGAGVLHGFRTGGSSPERLCRLELGEEVRASPVVCGGSLFVRTRTRLICLRATPTP